MENYLLRVGMGFGFGLGLGLGLSRRSHFLREILRERAIKIERASHPIHYRASIFIFLPLSFLSFKSLFRLRRPGGGKSCACDKYDAQWGGEDGLRSRLFKLYFVQCFETVRFGFCCRDCWFQNVVDAGDENFLCDNFSS
ncbi:hypothetical protein PanWU01x14_286660, partial [Parasponia andersonii]